VITNRLTGNRTDARMAERNGFIKDLLVMNHEWASRTLRAPLMDTLTPEFSTVTLSPLTSHLLDRFFALSSDLL
jgi:hypothetical protein